MSSNYPAGPMEGSGIYDTEEVIYVGCHQPKGGVNEDGEPDVVECGFSGAVDATIRGHKASWTCPGCGAEHEEDH